MISLRKLRMKTVKNLFMSKDDVKRVRCALEQKIEQAFIEFDGSRQNAQETTHSESFN